MGLVSEDDALFRTEEGGSEGVGEAAGAWRVCQGRRSKRGWDLPGQRAGEELGPPGRVWPLALNLGCPTPKGSMGRIHKLSREKLHVTSL